MQFLDLFSGLGGFRFALESIGHTCIGHVEKDKFVNRSYNEIHDNTNVWSAGDIQTVSNEELEQFVGKVDIITGGFSCQPFANGGLKLGFKDTRGTVFFDVARFANIIKPKALFLENVKGLVNHNKGNTIDTIIRSLNEIGYIVDFNILNSKYFGVPQSRDRVYIIAIREDLIQESKWLKDSTRRVVPQAKKRIMKTYDYMRVFNFNYPKEEHVTANLIELLEHRKFEDNDFVFDSTKEALLSIAENGEVRIKEATHLGYAIAEEGDSINIGFPNSDSRRGRVGKGLARTLEAGGVMQGVLDFKSDGELSIRLLTSLESFRLQAFPDWAHDKADAVVGKSQMYKQIGNSVTINVIKEIGINLTKTIENGEKLL